MAKSTGPAAETGLGEEAGPPPNAEKNSNKTQRPKSDFTTQIALDTEIFRTPDGREFADIWVDGKRQTLRIKNRGFRGYLYSRHRELTGACPKPDAVNAAVEAACAKALYDAPEQEVFVRIGQLNGRIYLDLGDDTFQTIEVSCHGWKLIETAPLRFIRPSGIKPLPVPDREGDIRHLWSLLNLQTEAQRAMFVGFLLAALRGRPPYPICVLSGEQGTSKSTTSKVGRECIDPSAAPLRGLSRTEQDLCITARNRHVLAFDNISSLREWLPDALCRLATGAGFSTRGLYTDDDEVIFDLARPLILNGIEDFVTRPDLADRCFFITLSAIPEDRRRTEEELMAEFEAHHPFILGALLNAMVIGLQRCNEIKLDRLPRMADVVRWVVACETAFFQEGTFLRVYNSSREEAFANALDAEPVACALRNFMNLRPDWTGTYSDLLYALAQSDGYASARNGWPGSPAALSNRLRRVEPLLRRIGIVISSSRCGKNGEKIVRILSVGEEAPAAETAV